MSPNTVPIVSYARKTAEGTQDLQSIGDVLAGALDKGKRVRDTENKEYRSRFPTNSERLNRALVELGLSAFKVHTLIWRWRGAPARGTLPFFTIRSLRKFCNLTRPTIRVALAELENKGWIIRKKYDRHHKNTLYQLVAVRKIPRPSKKRNQEKQKTEIIPAHPPYNQGKPPGRNTRCQQGAPLENPKQEERRW